MPGHVECRNGVQSRVATHSCDLVRSTRRWEGGRHGNAYCMRQLVRMNVHNASRCARSGAGRRGPRERRAWRGAGVPAIQQ